MSDLKPCPFCTAALVWSDTYSEYHHPVAKCILSGHKFKKGMIGQWNRRALPAVQPDDDKLVRHMTKLIAEGLNRIEQLIAERDAAVHLARMRKSFIEEARDERDAAEAERDRLRKELEAIANDYEAGYPLSHDAIKYAALAALKGETP